MLFVRLFGLCLFRFVGFSLPLGVWEGLRFVIVALPGLFSYLFFFFFFFFFFCYNVRIKRGTSLLISVTNKN